MTRMMSKLWIIRDPVKEIVKMSKNKTLKKKVRDKMSQKNMNFHIERRYWMTNSEVKMLFSLTNTNYSQDLQKDFLNRVMDHWTGACSGKCIVRWFCHRVNIREYTYTNLDDTAYCTPKLLQYSLFLLGCDLVQHIMYKTTQE